MLATSEASFSSGAQAGEFSAFVYFAEEVRGIAFKKED
jgi:hypothetical protein